jgi:flagellar basal body rod protein FlgC
VAGPGNPPASPPVLPVDLATEMTNLLSARISYSANAKVAELVRDLEKDTLDRLA